MKGATPTKTIMCVLEKIRIRGDLATDTPN